MVQVVPQCSGLGPGVSFKVQGLRLPYSVL